MDYGRFLRAMHAKSMQRVEDRRQQWFDKTIEELRPDEWQQVQRHDALVEEMED